MGSRIRRAACALLPWLIASVCATVALDGLAVRAHTPPPWEPKAVEAPPPKDKDPPPVHKSGPDPSTFESTSEVVPT